MSLSNKEKLRYARHLNLNNFGVEAQEKLKNTKVLVVGTGGLGSPLLQYLTAAGIGTLGVMDYDRVEASNLQRQVLFGSNDIGQPKTSVAIQKLTDQNPHVNFIEHNELLQSGNAMEIIKDYDLVADGTDNFPTRYLINDACYLLEKPYVYASIYQFEGQVSVFNFQNGPNYRDLFASPPPPGLVPSCAEGGVLGVLPGIIGSFQALEVIKIVTGIGKPLSGKLFLLDTLDFTTRYLNVRKDPENPLSGNHKTITSLIDYDEFCGVSVKPPIPSITVHELHELIENGEEFTLIDVREPNEHHSGSINGVLIPLNVVEENLDKIPPKGKVIIHCRSGKRSAEAIARLQEHHYYTNLINLEGGLLAWRNEIDSSLCVI